MKKSTSSSRSTNSAHTDKETDLEENLEETQVAQKCNILEISKRSGKESRALNSGEGAARTGVGVPQIYEKKPGGGLKVKEMTQYLRKAKSKSPVHLRQDPFAGRGISPVHRVIKFRSNSNSRQQLRVPPFNVMSKSYDKDSIEEGSVLAQEVAPTKANMVTKLLKDTRKTAGGIKLDTKLLKERELLKFRRRRNEQLWNAAEAGETKIVATLLNKAKFGGLTGEVNSKGLDDWRALHWAASEGHLQVAQVLLLNGAEVDAPTSNRRTALHICCVRSHLEIGMLLLTAKANVNSKDFAGNTPVHYASEFGHVNMMKLVLSHNPDLSIKNKGDKSSIDVALNIEVLKVFEDYIHKKKLAKAEQEKTLVKVDCLAPGGVKKPELAKVQMSREKLELRMRSKAKRIPILETHSPKGHNVYTHSRSGGQYSKSSGTNSGISQTTSSSTHLEEEEKLGPEAFRPLQLVGKGSFGEVYLVQKKNSKNYYAMKILSKKKIMGHNLVKYAKTERNVLSITKHPFIVGLHYAFQTAERLYIIMEYCPGGDLGQTLRRERRFTEDRARIYLAEILLALEDLHRRDIIFRDLKPDNVVLDADGHVLLTDFGLSKQGILDNNSAKSFCGSVAYLAPEMLRRSGHGKSVDWYLLGVLLYEMLVGIPPYFNKDREILFQNIQKAPLKLPTFVSENSKNLLLGLLHRNPHKRLGSGQGDAEEIKVQPFFKPINWDLCFARKLPVPKPQIKQIMSMEMRESVIGDKEEIKEQNMISDWSFIMPNKSQGATLKLGNVNLGNQRFV